MKWTQAEIEREQYQSRVKALRDYNWLYGIGYHSDNQMEQAKAREIGRAEGYSEAYAEGHEEGRAIAHREGNIRTIQLFDEILGQPKTPLTELTSLSLDDLIKMVALRHEKMGKRVFSA